MNRPALRLNTGDITQAAPGLRAGDRVLLSGAVYTARDAAHKRFAALLDAGEPLPIPLAGSVIYYAGPTQAPKGLVIGSCGPTTSSRMDPYTPRLLSLGLSGMIGKGARSREVAGAIAAAGAVYFCAIGGAGALYARCVRECDVVAFDDLGCESVKRLLVEDFPVIVACDAAGNDLYAR